MDLRMRLLALERGTVLIDRRRDEGVRVVEGTGDIEVDDAVRCSGRRDDLGEHGLELVALSGLGMDL